MKLLKSLHPNVNECEHKEHCTKPKHMTMICEPNRSNVFVRHRNKQTFFFNIDTSLDETKQNVFILI